MLDPKLQKRTRNPELMRRLHLGVHECALCGTTFGIVLHHIKKRSQGGDDSEENLVYLCQGPGTNDCHGRLHDGDDQILWALSLYLKRVESDIRSTD